MKKWLGSLVIIIALAGIGQSAFAIEVQPLIPNFDKLNIQIPSKKVEKNMDPLPAYIGNKASKEIKKVKTIG